MSKFLSGKLLRLITAAALVMQLGVVAFHYHNEDPLEAHAAHASSFVQFAHQSEVDDYHDHGSHDHSSHGSPDHHGHDGDHHAPHDEAEHDCDLCLLKSGIAHAALVPASSMFLFAELPSHGPIVAQQHFYRPFHLDNYGARAPPLGRFIS